MQPNKQRNTKRKKESTQILSPSSVSRPPGALYRIFALFPSTFLLLFLLLFFSSPNPSPAQDSHSNLKTRALSLLLIPHLALRSDFQKRNWDHITTCSIILQSAQRRWSELLSLSRKPPQSGPTSLSWPHFSWLFFSRIFQPLLTSTVSFFTCNTLIGNG